MATTVSQQYEHPTVKLKIEGQSSGDSSSDLSTIERDLTLELVIRRQNTTQVIQGDQQLLLDLTRVLERYLSYQLQAQPQGTFTGSVAIRPLDFIFHRLTVRQGEGIAQVDLSMTQLYDLLEAVEAAKQALPPLETLKQPSPTPSAWFAQPSAIAALLVAGVGVMAATTVLTSRAPETESTSLSSSNEAQITALEQEAGGEPPEPPTEAPVQADVGEEIESTGSTASSPDQQLSPLDQEGTDQEDPGIESDELSSNLARRVPTPESPQESDPDLRTEPQAERVPAAPTLGEERDTDEVSSGDVIGALRAARQEEQAQSFRSAEPREQRLSEAGLTLESSLSDWQTPEDLEENLSYAVVVDEDGMILAVDPQDETSEDHQDLTPLAGAELADEVELPSDVESFLVILGTTDQVNVSPFF